MLIIALLLLMLVLTGIVTYQAEDAARSHRATAERALRTYSAFASWSLYTYGQQVIFQELRTTLDSVRLSLAAATANGRAMPAFADGERCGCLWGSGGRTSFALPGRGRTLLSSERLPAAARAWILDSLPNARGASAGRGLSIALAFPSGGTEAVAYAVRRGPDGRVDAIYGYIEPADSVGAIFRALLRIFPLLPEPLLDGGPNERLLSATVATPAGHTIYRSPAVASEAEAFPSTHVLPAFFGRVGVRVGLRPATAEPLFVGGLPSTRLPLLLGMLALNIALFVLAVLQLRRGVEFARVREAFVSSVSHELRTPLAQIRMFAETLLLGRARSEAEQRRSLEIIDQEAKRLTQLVENVLHVTRAGRGVRELASERVDLSAEVAATVDDFRVFADRGRADLALDLQEGVTAIADRGGIHQVLINLLENALKYGPPGQRVLVGLRESDGIVRLWVDDQGPGIPLHDRKKVFKAFFRSAGHGASPVAGSGIGLAVVRDIVKAYAGRVWVEEAPGGGARVVIELPGRSAIPESTGAGVVAHTAVGTWPTS